jgi:hypothetical protein
VNLRRTRRTFAAKDQQPEEQPFALDCKSRLACTSRHVKLVCRSFVKNQGTCAARGLLRGTNKRTAGLRRTASRPREIPLTRHAAQTLFAGGRAGFLSMRARGHRPRNMPLTRALPIAPFLSASEEMYPSQRWGRHKREQLSKCALDN